MATDGRELFTLVVRKRSLAEDGGKSCDGKGEDARLRAPGADWNLIVSLRDVALQDFKSKIQAVFEVLSKRFGETSVVVGSTTVSSVCTTPPPCLPTRSSVLGATVIKNADTDLGQIPLQRSSTFNSIPLELEAEVKSGCSETELAISCPPESSESVARIQPKLQWNSGAEVKQASPEKNFITSSPFENMADIDLAQVPRTSVSGKKRLRSVSLEKLDVILPKKQLLQVSTGGTEIVAMPQALSQATTVHTFKSSDACQNLQVEQLTKDTRGTTNKYNSDNSKKILPCENFLSSFYARKHDAATAVESVVNSAVVGRTKTFLPTSPKSLDKSDARAGKQKLAEKIMLKQEEEEKRKKELEAKKEQERLERIRKREERAKKVMEKNAALRREEDEKKKGQEQKLQDVHMKKQYLIQQKTQDLHRKVLERQLAAETRKKQEEELKAKKLQELKKAEEVHPELPGEEKKQKKVEKIKEKQTKGIMEKNTFGNAKQEHDVRVRIEATKLLEAQAQLELEEAKKEQERIRIEKLFASDIVKKPLSNNKKLPFEIVLAPNDRGEKELGVSQHASLTAPTPIQSAKNAAAASYTMTPADAITEYENYSIGDLSSGDSTDEECSPKKPIPEWAHQTKLNKWMENQENSIATNEVSVESIFPPKQLLHTPELEKIFKTKRKCFFVRSSSAKWNSPLLK
ncbi:hypothetical protein EMCRGX_G013333 [Ephydatia muelleri]